MRIRALYPASLLVFRLLRRETIAVVKVMYATTATAPAIGLQVAVRGRAMQRLQAFSEGAEAKEGAEPHLEDGDMDQLQVKSSKTNTMRVALLLAISHSDVTMRARRDWEKQSPTKKRHNGGTCDVRTFGSQIAHHTENNSVHSSTWVT